MAEITKPVALDETLQRCAAALEATASDVRQIFLPYAAGLTDTIQLSPATAVYRVAPTASGTTVTIPTPDATAIPTAAAYFCFELEVSVDAACETLVGPGSSDDWTWIAQGELPDATKAAGKTVYIAARLDCTARTFVANVYDVR